MLTQEHCIPCRTGTAALEKAEANALMADIPGWEMAEDGRSLRREYSFRNFKEALAFVNAVGEQAEKERHHPDIALGWGYVRLVLTTHAAGGLHRNDFILAAKINNLG